MVVASACGESPTSINNGRDIDSTANRPVADAPGLPVPSGPTADMPVTSDTLAKIERTERANLERLSDACAVLSMVRTLTDADHPRLGQYRLRPASPVLGAQDPGGRRGRVSLADRGYRRLYLDDVHAGTSTTETETFAETVSASGGLDLGVLTANVSLALSQSFSTSVTIMEARTETFTKMVRGTAGKTVRFMAWESVERYTISDENGAPFSDPNLAVRTDTLYRRGVATALQATEF